MFKITPINDSELQMKYASLVGALYRDGYFAYAMTDVETGELMGFSQFEICKGYGYISDLKEMPGRSDFEAMFILGRQTLNFIDMMGVHTAIADKDSIDPKLLHAVGFRDSDGKQVCDMTGMFDGKCSGHKIEL
jgi:hypothetical protein